MEKKKDKRDKANDLVRWTCQVICRRLSEGDQSVQQTSMISSSLEKTEILSKYWPLRTDTVLIFCMNPFLISVSCMPAFCHSWNVHDFIPTSIVYNTREASMLWKVYIYNTDLISKLFIFNASRERGLRICDQSS